MTTTEFARIIERAVAGDSKAMKDLLVKYRPLFENCSFRNGVLDEDCKQYVMMRVIMQIPKFRL